MAHQHIQLFKHPVTCSTWRHRYNESCSVSANWKAPCPYIKDNRNGYLVTRVLRIFTEKSGVAVMMLQLKLNPKNLSETDERTAESEASCIASLMKSRVELYLAGCGGYMISPRGLMLYP